MLWLLPGVGIATTPASAQFHDADPEAMAAFERLVDGYRSRPALGVESTVEISVSPTSEGKPPSPSISEQELPGRLRSW